MWLLTLWACSISLRKEGKTSKRTTRQRWMNGRKLGRQSDFTASTGSQRSKNALQRGSNMRQARSTGMSLSTHAVIKQRTQNMKKCCNTLKRYGTIILLGNRKTKRSKLKPYQWIRNLLNHRTSWQQWTLCLWSTDFSLSCKTPLRETHKTQRKGSDWWTATYRNWIRK